MAKIAEVLNGAVAVIISPPEYEDVALTVQQRRDFGRDVYITNDLVEIGDPVVNGKVVTKKQFITKYTYDEFTELFTDAELENILTAAKTDVKIEVFLTRMKAKPVINVRNNKIEAKIQYLEAQTHIGIGRAAEIIRGTEVVI